MRTIKHGELFPYGIYRRPPEFSASRIGIRLPFGFWFGNVYHPTMDSVSKGWYIKDAYIQFTKHLHQRVDISIAWQKSPIGEHVTVAEGFWEKAK